MAAVDRVEKKAGQGGMAEWGRRRDEKKPSASSSYRFQALRRPSNGIQRVSSKAKGPDALDWQNLFRPSKILDEICLRQIFNLPSAVGALIHSKIFDNQKFQSHGNKHHRLLAVRRKAYMRSQESSWDLRSHPLRSNMLPRHIIACALVFFPSLNSFNSSRSSCYFYYASGGFSFFRMQRSGSRNNFSGLRTSILRLKIEIKFSWLPFSFKSWRVN